MPLRLSIIPLLAALLLSGCQKEEVHTYQVPKEAPPPATESSPGMTDQTTSSAGLVWAAPDHWEDQAASGVRRGSYQAVDADGQVADISIIAFPGDVGGMSANFNRWRTQVGLSPLPDADVQATIEHQDTPTFHLDVVNYLGEANGVPTRVAGAIMSHAGESWFFKIIGPASVVDTELPAFRAFLQTIAPSS
jgi:hypothetical protein